MGMNFIIIKFELETGDCQFKNPPILKNPHPLTGLHYTDPVHRLNSVALCTAPTPCHLSKCHDKPPSFFSNPTPSIPTPSPTSQLDCAKKTTPSFAVATFLRHKLQHTPWQPSTTARWRNVRRPSLPQTYPHPRPKHWQNFSPLFRRLTSKPWHRVACSTSPGTKPWSTQPSTHFNWKQNGAPVKS